MSGNWSGVFDNPYVPGSQSYRPEGLKLEELIRNAINAQLLDLHVALPASITAVLGNQKVSVQPLLQQRYVNTEDTAGQPENLPVIQNVMVWMPRGAGFSFKFPLKVGDTGLLIFSERSLDIWSAGNGGIVDPADVRHHDLSDPIFFPGLVPFAQQTTDQTTDLVVQSGSSQLRLQQNGKFLLKNNSEELLTQLGELAGQLASLGSAFQDISFAATYPGVAAAAAAVASAASTIQSKIVDLTGS